MPWVKLDDGFWRHRKVRKAWREPRAVGLHVLALTYVSEELSDGWVDPEWVEQTLPNRAERDRVVGKLVEVGLWDEFGDGWQIHDFLEYNPSADKVAEIRAARRAAGQRGAEVTNKGRGKRRGKLPRQFGVHAVDYEPRQDGGNAVAPYPVPHNPKGLSLGVLGENDRDSEGDVDLGGTAA